MEVTKIGFNTCKEVYNKLGNKNARTTLKLFKLLNKQGVMPVISRLDKDVAEFKFETPDMDGVSVSYTQEYDFGQKVLKQYTSVPYLYIDGQFHRTGREEVFSFDDIVNLDEWAERYAQEVERREFEAIEESKHIVLNV